MRRLRLFCTGVEIAHHVVGWRRAIPLAWRIARTTPPPLSSLSGDSYLGDSY